MYEIKITYKFIFTSVYSYVDAYRNMAVKLGEQTDLKRVMKNHRGFGSAPVAVTTVHDLGPGDPDDETYLKQAKHLMRKGELASAVEYVGFALRINPASKVRITIVRTWDGSNHFYRRRRHRSTIKLFFLLCLVQEHFCQYSCGT